MLEHGGRLRQAAQRYDIPLAHWLDLSTGISPWSWIEERPQTIPTACWSRLPEDDDELGAAARAYYGCDALPVAGSQAAIQALPGLRRSADVGVLSPAYAEHGQAWKRAGHRVVPFEASALRQATERLDVVVVVQPNNPDGSRLPTATLLDAHARLAVRGGWLVIDEAFADAEPALSLAAHGGRPGLIVLRSLGKFFGLAGARVGFVLAEAKLRHALQEALGPWALSGPSRHLAAAALGDTPWQHLQRARLQHAAQQLNATLLDAGFTRDGGSPLFRWTRLANAAAIHHALASRGILTRLFAAPGGLRFGLPRDAAECARLRESLRQCPAPQALTSETPAQDGTRQ